MNIQKFLAKKILVEKIVGSKSYFCSKKIVSSKKMFGSKKCSAKKNYLKKYLPQD